MQTKELEWVVPDRAERIQQQAERLGILIEEQHTRLSIGGPVSPLRLSEIMLDEIICLLDLLDRSESC